ncbi:Zinc finger A20 and AN1 domain-containing stress-associated protein 7 [Hibiscus syriacus]|uniref:Zinc finger A20 and AN1 domain-containing stress-associated protein 7 n=1 Tax=Hibiscus syriacus TaxID=106335 RepID=A0A6A2XX11_HIBSY|nr:Zinc finger A20 and AN1 domain-containing stress-associated protein 7 [Hibiscus syriacus]
MRSLMKRLSPSRSYFTRVPHRLQFRNNRPLSSPKMKTRVEVAEQVLHLRKECGVDWVQVPLRSTFCGEHWYPEKHECSFDFKGTNHDAIANTIPVIKADKVYLRFQGHR